MLLASTYFRSRSEVLSRVLARGEVRRAHHRRRAADWSTSFNLENDTFGMSAVNPASLRSADLPFCPLFFVLAWPKLETTSSLYSSGFSTMELPVWGFVDRRSTVERKNEKTKERTASRSRGLDVLCAAVLCDTAESKSNSQHQHLEPWPVVGDVD